MAIVRFDPFRELPALQGSLRGDGGWVPPVDIYEAADKALVIKAELPEMKREAIAVTVEHGTLTISGERALPADVKREDYRRVERPYGAFSRRFALPSTGRRRRRWRPSTRTACSACACRCAKSRSRAPCRSRWRRNVTSFLDALGRAGGGPVGAARIVPGVTVTVVGRARPSAPPCSGS